MTTSLRPVSARRGRRARLSCTLVALAAGVLSAAASPVVAAQPEPLTPIEHFVFLFQENHSFDNYFGTRPGVDGIPDGTCMPVTPGKERPCVEPFHIGKRAVTDLGHTEAAFARQYNRGRMDGFVHANSDYGEDGSLAMGYYDDRDMPYYWNIADEYVVFDRFFSSSVGGSVKNHMYAVAAHPGVTGKEELPAEGWGDLRTIFDLMDEAGVSWKFYIQNYDPEITYRTRDQVEEVDRAAQVIWAPVLAFGRYLDDPDVFSRIVDMDEFYEDTANGTLPAVSYLVPSGASEHPPGSIQAGQRFVRSLINELMRSPLWASSAFFWTYDDWGGWYDHVPPPRLDDQGLGFRVPALLVSPYARRGFVGSRQAEFSSVLSFIEANWGLEPLTERDARASDLMYAFDFDQPPREPVILDMRRDVPPPTPPNAIPVYATYAAATAFGAGLWVLASLRAGRTRQQRGDRT